MFVAGDPSGDQHASHVLRRLATLVRGGNFFGIGGPAMQSQGLVPLMPFEAFNTMGFWEVLSHVPFFLKAKKRLVAAMDEYRPAALVCVDYPGLNIPLMREAHKRGIPVVWYIVPQVWAWKKKRAALLGRYASYIGCVFPFEAGYFKPFAAPVSFVGHPLVEAMEGRAASLPENALPPDNAPIGAHAFRLSLVPGSRRQEVAAILPSMVKAALLLRKDHPGLAVTVSRCKNLPHALYQKVCTGTGIALFEGPLCELLAETEGALVTSGTATLETALAKVPMVIAYRTSQITYRLMKRMIRVRCIGLPNIVAGEKIVPECIQSEATGQKLAQEMSAFITSKDLYRRTKEKLSRLESLLGGKQPSKEIAEAIAGFVRKQSMQ